jgi:diguanylate cyclase (GGDEF)-like protein/PAS domain S-box-containing protein
MHEEPTKVLLVDDDEDDFVLTRDLLCEIRDGAFTLDWVQSYDEAMDAILHGEHDVCLLDYQLGGQNGLELLRQTSRRRRAPVILLTGQGDHEVDVEAMKAGAADYLIKARIDASLLGRSIRYALERARSLRDLRESEERYQRLVELSPDTILVHADRLIVFINSAGVRLLGAEGPQQLIGLPIMDFVHDDSKDAVERRVAKLLEEGVEAPFAEEKLKRLDGSLFDAEVAAVPFVFRNGPAVQVVARDISARKQTEERLVHEAFHDPLTGLANRALFLEHLKLAIERAKRPKSYLFAVLFLDLDRFKNINDSLGHTVGDQLLGVIARRLERCLRHIDIVARFGGDEFAVLLDGIDDSSDAVRVAERIQAELRTPLKIGGHEVFTSASIGIAFSDRGYRQTEEIVRDADTAMYRAKALGKARHEIFDTEMHARAVTILQLETDLRRAMEREEFCVHYQPIVSLNNDGLYGFEALVRWRHPERGLIMPTEFIPIAEETGVIVPLGRWVLQQACEQMCRWQKRFPGAQGLMLSVNMSGKQFAQPDLFHQVKKVLRETGFNPSLLQLEITESAVIENTATVTDMLVQLRALGIKLSMDDFGTGYSSLSYLHRFPIDTLKIDRSFISSNTESGEIGIVRTIIMLARDLGMNVVAEGVETFEQLSYLRSLDCELGQGYYFSYPVDVMAITDLLEAHSSGHPLSISLVDDAVQPVG